MTILEKIEKLTNKQKGLGLPVTVIAHYFGCHPNAIKYYINGAEMSESVEEKYQLGLTQLLEDIKNIVEG